jgi:hypothetical protein
MVSGSRHSEATFLRYERRTDITFNGCKALDFWGMRGMWRARGAPHSAPSPMFSCFPPSTRTLRSALLSWALQNGPTLRPGASASKHIDAMCRNYYTRLFLTCSEGPARKSIGLHKIVQHMHTDNVLWQFCFTNEYRIFRGGCFDRLPGLGNIGNGTLQG